MNSDADKTLVGFLREQLHVLSDVRSSIGTKAVASRNYPAADTIAGVLVRVEGPDEARTNMQQDPRGTDSFLLIAQQLVDSIEGGNVSTTIQSGYPGRPYSLLCLIMLEHMDFVKRERPNLYHAA